MKISSKLSSFRSVGAAGAIAGCLLFAAAGTALAYETNPKWGPFTDGDDTEEGETFRPAAQSAPGELVRYGAHHFEGHPAMGGKWTYKFFPNGTSFTCSNDTFAVDPYWARRKRCEKFSDPGNWIAIAGEGDRIPSSETNYVTYGMFDENGLNVGIFTPILKGKAGQVCNNDAFGYDPFHGTLKACFAYLHSICPYPPSSATMFCTM